MLSAVIPPERSQPAVPLARQPAYQRFVHPGPLVLWAGLLRIPTSAEDRDQTVSRRSEPSSRAALIGEQPNPWDLLQPQDATSRHRGAKPPRRCGLLGEISLLSPRGSFYPLSDAAPVRRHRITISDFRPCSDRRPRSQARLCDYTRHPIANRAERTFERLRYSLGGNRPS